MNHKRLLQKLRACSEAVEWYGDQDGYKAWRQCKRGDWLLWIAARLNIDHKLIVQAACDCAETALRFVPDGEDRPRQTIETARKWCEGKATLKEVRAASDAAASVAYSAASVAYSAAYYAASAASAASVASVAYSAASVAYYAASAASAASDNDRTKWLAKFAVIVRRRIPWQLVKAAIENAENVKGIE